MRVAQHSTHTNHTYTHDNLTLEVDTHASFPYAHRTES